MSIFKLQSQMKVLHMRPTAYMEIISDNEQKLIDIDEAVITDELFTIGFDPKEYLLRNHKKKKKKGYRFTGYSAQCL